MRTGGWDAHGGRSRVQMGHVKRTGVERNFCLGSLQDGMWCQGGGALSALGRKSWEARGCGQDDGLTLDAGTGHCTGAGIWERRRGQGGRSSAI